MSKYHEVSKIHQVMILDGGELPDQLPLLIRDNMEFSRSVYPESEYHLWSGNSLQSFIAEKFSPDVLWAYKHLVPYSYRCDLGRFCLLYIYGGIYLDLGLRLMNRWPVPKMKGFAAFRDVSFISTSWSAMQTGLLWAEPGREELKFAIDWIVENCRTRYYGEDPLYPTGPVLLGRACIAAMVSKGQSPAADDQHIGECRCVTPDAEMLNISYVSKEGVLTALRTKRVGGDLTHMGVIGVNNYNVLWRSRQVYGEIDRVWNFDDVAIKGLQNSIKTKSGLAIASRTVGRMTYGPFVTLDAGLYSLKVEFSPETRFSRLQIDICAGSGSNIIHVFNLQHDSVQRHDAVSFDFRLPVSSLDVEFRLSVFGDFSGEARRFTIRDIASWEWRFDNEALRTEEGERTPTGISLLSSARGGSRLVYGPYVALKAGQYALTVAFSSLSKFRDISVNIGAGDQNETLLVLRSRRGKTLPESKVVLPFRLAKDESNVEFRLHVGKEFRGEFIGYELIRLPFSDVSQKVIEQDSVGRK